jgi:Mlc titration factor MtfA (ptsG expression regulator)
MWRFSITAEVRIITAAQACLLLLYRKTDYFPAAHDSRLSIVAMVEENDRLQSIFGKRNANRLGETGRRMGSLVLSWGAVKHGALIL